MTDETSDVCVYAWPKIFLRALRRVPSTPMRDLWIPLSMSHIILMGITIISPRKIIPYWIIHHLDPNIEISKTSHFCGFLCSSLFEIFLLKHVCEKKRIDLQELLFNITKKGITLKTRDPEGSKVLYVWLFTKWYFVIGYRDKNAYLNIMHSYKYTDFLMK